MHYKTQQILSLCTSRGAVHDFELFKRNLNHSLKTFKILAERYRNRGKRLSLRFNLIAVIYNMELNKK